MPTEFVVTQTPLKLFNTLTRTKDSLATIEPGRIRMYTCGPTVYDFAHIGNFRTYVFEDILRRTLKFFGYDVTQVMNITDVDDKTIKGAIKKGVTLKEYTKPFEDAFFDDLKQLHIEPAEHYPAATDYIPQMIDMIHQLIAKGVAYAGRDGSVYFAIGKFPKYGCLSHLKLDELQVGASERVTADEYDKENVSDFVLWKAYDAERDGQIYWESPWGKGRPGWHLECSVMAMSILGESLDIHCGGVDNMFPHHENEIAQSEACSGKVFSSLWMHSEHLVVDNKKMSKSLGNFYTLRDLLNKGFTGMQVRYLLMQTHYKTKLNFTFQGLEAAKGSLTRLNDFIQRLHGIKGDKSQGKSDAILQKAFADFSAALGDDLNISAALAAVFDMVREINALADQNALSESDAERILALMERFNSVMGVMELKHEAAMAPQDILDALKARGEARASRNWAKADELRDYITGKGYIIEDTAAGPMVKKG
ncbi:MAG: cysteine--tRNA ligase [Chlamydiales bacterium]|nr:cysteine--tRNA ligase [Chlamydiales bacterium]